MPTTRRRPPHKIDQDVPYQDVKPPSMLETITLGCLKLHMSYKRPRRTNEAVEDEIDIRYMLASSSPLLPPSSLLDMQLDDETQPSSWIGEMEDVQQLSQDVDGFADCFMLNERSSNLMSSSPLLPVVHHDDEHDTSTDAEYMPSSHSLQGEHVLDSVSIDESVELVLLIDHAIRRVLQAQSRRTDKNISVNSTGIEHHLSSLAPAICIPGYITAVAAQAVFVQRSARSITSIRQRGLQQLAEPTEQPVLIAEHLEKSLWQLLDQAVARKASKPRLRPIELARLTAMPSSPIGSDTMAVQQSDIDRENHVILDEDCLLSELESDSSDESDLLEE